MNPQIRTDFRRFLDAGPYATPPGRAACALDHARILAAWREAEDAGHVRLRSEPEHECYFDVYGEPDDERERERISDLIDRLGCYWVVAEYLTEDDEWEQADSIGMCIYKDPECPFENCYVPGLMQSALHMLPREVMP